MIRLLSTKSLITSLIALGAIVAGSAAHARTDVTLALGLNSPKAPAPVLVQHRYDRLDFDRYDRYDRHDRYDRYDRHGRYDRRGGARGDADRDGVPNRFDRDSRFYNPRATQRHPQWADFDRDGVVNRFDRAPRNPRRY